MRPSRRSSARFLSLVVATSLASSARLATAHPEPPQSGKLAALNQPLGEDDPSASSHPLLAKGSQGTAVELVQEILNQDRAAHGANAIAEDGDFGPDTQTALRSFQKEHGLEQTGTVDAETWDQLDASVAPQASAPASNGDGSDSATPAATPDATGPLTGTVQAIETLSVNGGTPSGSGSTKTSGSKATSTPKPATGAVTHAPMHLSAASLDQLARLIESEAGVCSLEGKTAVGAVVLNRVRAGYANGTVLGVISESGQFDGYDDATYHSTPSKDSRAAAAAAAAGQDPSDGAFYYYNPYLVHPAWGKTMHETVQIGTNRDNTHRFMKP